MATHSKKHTDLWDRIGARERSTWPGYLRYMERNPVYFLWLSGKANMVQNIRREWQQSKRLSAAWELPGECITRAGAIKSYPAAM